MKLNFKSLFVIVLATFFISCEDDNNLTETTIAGKWNVIQTIGGAFQPRDYEKGSFTWEFNMTQKAVTIVNGTNIDDSLTPPSFINNRGGTYSFEIVEENDVNFLVVGNRKGSIKLENNKLTLDYGVAVDDIGYVFER